MQTDSVEDTNTSRLDFTELMTEPNELFNEFCEAHQQKNPRVKLSTLQKNNMMQSNFLEQYYIDTISKYTQHPEIQNDEDFTALLAFFVNHMENVHNPEPFNIGRGLTTTVRAARTASFQYCMELLPQIQKKLLAIAS